MLSEKRTVEIYDRCQTPECNRVLHSIREAINGQCSTCWMKAMPEDKKKAMNRLIASAFNGSTKAEQKSAVDDALSKFTQREEDKK